LAADEVLSEGGVKEFVCPQPLVIADGASFMDEEEPSDYGFGGGEWRPHSRQNALVLASRGEDRSKVGLQFVRRRPLDRG
jgi:hypothetical protein